MHCLCMNYQYLQHRKTGEWLGILVKMRGHPRLMMIEFKVRLSECARGSPDGSNPCSMKVRYWPNSALNSSEYLDQRRSAMRWIAELAIPSSAGPLTTRSSYGPSPTAGQSIHCAAIMQSWNLLAWNLASVLILGFILFGSQHLEIPRRICKAWNEKPINHRSFNLRT